MVGVSADAGKRGGGIVKTLEFRAHVSEDRTLIVPEELASQLHPDEPVRVILLVATPSEDEAWSRLAADEFLKGYADGDAIYDDLPPG
jgi:hypothetical protein